MTTTVACLLEGTVVTVEGIGYTSNNCVTQLDKITATNEGTGIATVTLKLLSPDGTLTQTFSKTIPVNGAPWPFPDATGHILGIGGKANFTSSVANAIRVRVSGRQFT